MKFFVGLAILIASSYILLLLLQPQVKELQPQVKELQPQEKELKSYPEHPLPLSDQIVKVDLAETNSNAPFISNSTVLWQPSIDVKTKPHLRSDITDAALVRYERDDLLNISEGAVVDVYIPQLKENLVVLIASSELLSSGNVSIKGYLEANDMFSFVMTVGENSMFATIETAEGIYNVRGNSESAWIIPALSLRKQMNTEVLDYRSINPETPPVLSNPKG